MFSCKCWTSTKFVREELTVKTLPLSRHGQIILKSMAQTKEICDSLVLSRSDFWMVWRCDGILCAHFYFFCLEPVVKKDTWMRTPSVTVMVIFFRKLHFENYLITAMFLILSQQFMRYIDSSFSKDTLQLKILQT